MLQIAGAKVRSANMTKAENLRRGDTQGALLVMLKCKVRTRKCENNQCGMGRADFTLHRTLWVRSSGLIQAHLEEDEQSRKS